MTLKAGTVCYIVKSRAPELIGRVVTLTAGPFEYHGQTMWQFEPAMVAWGKCWSDAAADYLRPISDPDQPVDVTSDTDEPVVV
jgi:hypothetical protein